MKYIIFSDTHLTGNFRKRKFKFLKELFERSDKVIINGDFWDGFLVSFDEFIKSQWSELFEVLKRKKTVYIYGNHDKKKWIDKRVFRFCDELVSIYKIESKDKKFIVEHGNSIDLSIEEKWPKISNKVTAFLALNLKSLGSKIFGHKFYDWFFLSVKGHKKLYNWAKNNFSPNVYYVFSHSHKGIIIEEDHFINTGFIGQGNASYVEIEDGKIRLIKEKY